MRKFSQIEKVNEMKYGQPLIGDEKVHMKNLLIAASGNDQRVLNDIVDCLSDSQMKTCYEKLAKSYGYTGSIGQIVKPSV
jgi:hypothetical protein